jgi:hypothetical protein
MPMTASNAQATVNVDVDSRVTAAVAAWATELTGRAVWTASGIRAPGWVAMVVALLDDLAAKLVQADGHLVGTTRQAGTTDPASTPGTHGALLRGLFAGQVAPTALPSDAAPAEAPATMRALLEELGAARRAVDAADTLAVAQRVGDAEDVAYALAGYEHASLAYHLVAGGRPAGEADGGAGS